MTDLDAPLQTGQAMRSEDRADYQQFFKQATDKVVLDVSYTIYYPETEKEGFSSLPEEKIIFTLVDYKKTPHVVLRHHMDASVFRVLAWDMLFDRFPKVWGNKTQDKTQWPSYVEHKGSSHSRSQNGQAEARRLTLAFNPDPSRNYPWMIKLERGSGEVIGKGAVKMVQVQDTVTMQLTNLHMRQLAAEGMEFLQAQRSLRVAAASIAAL